MTSEPGLRVNVGNLSGVFAPALAAPAVLAWLEGFRTSPAIETVRAARNTLYRLRGDIDGHAVDLGVKAFGREARLKQWLDRRRGSKAERSWRIASRLAAAGVGTPEPAGFLERWEGSRLAESYYFCAFRENVPTLKDELLRLFRERGRCSEFMDLIQCVALEIRRMHDAGVLHRDLGNQNIFVRPQPGGGWGGVEFFDLNRARIEPSPTPEQRGRDLARIYLPSDFMRVFQEMYWAPQPVPPECPRAEASSRAAFARHSRSRVWRHPIREARVRRSRDPRETYPAENDMWVWDDRSAQPVSVPLRRDRVRHYPPLRNARIALAAATALPGLRRAYREAISEAFTRPVDMAGRAGVAIHPDPRTWERELPFLEALGSVPVLIRLYHHDPAAAEAAAAIGKSLHAAGRETAFALVQDRDAVRDPARWRSFVDRMMEQVAPFAASVEIGHAVNRTKWGLWDPAEYAVLAAPLVDWKRRHPGLVLSGPACIDFEYPYVAACLRNLPDGLSLDALSHHLYVDRRGPPEAFQGRFDTVRKLALARALAERSGRCSARVIISEVNWPLSGTGVWSPVTSPYDTPGIVRRKDPSIGEDDYADYMIRYLLCTLCSGLAERVYWWRLAARGYGLVDDTDPTAWRARPAHAMLANFLRRMTGARFLSREVSPERAERYTFEGAQGGRFSLLFAPFGPAPLPVAWSAGNFTDAFGVALATPTLLAGRPCYAFAEPGRTSSVS